MYFKLYDCLLSGFNPAETKIRAADGKIWRGEGFHISRELYRDIALQLTGKTQTQQIKPHNLLSEAEKFVLQSIKSEKQKNGSKECEMYWTLQGVTF